MERRAHERCDVTTAGGHDVVGRGGALMGVAAFTRARDELRTIDVSAAPDAATDAIARAIQQVAPYRLGAVLATDPQTLLPAGGTIVGFSPTDCGPFWD